MSEKERDTFFESFSIAFFMTMLLNIILIDFSRCSSPVGLVCVCVFYACYNLQCVINYKFQITAVHFTLIHGALCLLLAWLNWCGYFGSVFMVHWLFARAFTSDQYTMTNDGINDMLLQAKNMYKYFCPLINFATAWNDINTLSNTYLSKR